jgi:predicted transcriptional regulator
MNFRKLVARDLMNEDVLTVPEDWSAKQLAEFLTENEISGAPVVDARAAVVGVVSLTDLARSEVEEGRIIPDRSDPDYWVRGWEDKVSEEDLAGLRLEEDGPLVSDLMNPAVFSVDEDTSVSDVARSMIDARIHRVLVTKGRKIVGIVTTTDLLGLLVEEPLN